MKKKNKRNFLIVIIICIVFGFVITTPISNVSGTEFSDELQYEQFNSLDSLENWFDGVETFYFGSDKWITSEPFNLAISSGLSDGHTNFLDIEGTYDVVVRYNRVNYWDLIDINQDSDGYVIEGFLYYIDGYGGTLFELMNDNDKPILSFGWLKDYYSPGQDDYSFVVGLEQDDYQYKNVYDFWIDDDFNNYIPVYLFADNGGSSHWIHLSIKAEYFDDTYTRYYCYFDGILKDIIEFEHTIDTEIEKLSVLVEDFNTHHNYIDALGFNTYTNEIYSDNFLTQISNRKYEQFDNLNGFTSNDYFSMFDTLVSKYPSETNNYRTELMVDKIITQNFVDNSRILRIEGTGNDDVKYKVNQFYFNELNETYNDYILNNITNDYNSSGKSDYNINTGTLIKDGNLESVDSNSLEVSSETIENTETLIWDFTGETGKTDTDISWVDYVNPLSVICEVYGSVDGRNEVLAYKRGGSGAGYSDGPRHYFENEYTDGNISFYFNEHGTSTSVYGGLWHLQNDVGTNVITISVWMDYVKITYGGGSQQWYYGNPWNLITLEMFVANQTVRLHINDNYKGNYAFQNTVDNYQQCYFSHSPNVPVPLYVDDFSCTKEKTTKEVIELDIESNSLTETKGYNYSLNTYITVNNTQLLNVSLYNYSNSEWINIYYAYTNISGVNLTYDFTDITDFYSLSDTISLKYIGINESDYFQLNIDCLNLTYLKDTPYKPDNQTLIIRVDTFDDDGMLMNILYWNIDFNNSAGLITWEIFYRESAEVPIWHNYPTNPIFNFADYLDGEMLENLQINAHFFLTNYDNQNWLHIRTEVCFNDNYDNVYVYDKVIDLGDSDFYDTQNGLKVRYIDYFNDNYFTPYTFSNLKGYRALQLNTTQMKYNFLECGFYKSNLDIYYVPDIPDIPEPEPDKIPKPTEPTGTFWYYESCYLDISHTETHQIGNWSLDFSLITIKSITSKFYYDTEVVDYQEYGDWTEIFENAIKLLANIIIGIVNMIILFFQFILYFGVLAFNYILVFLIIGLISVFLWNALVRSLFLAGANFIWIIYYSLQWLFYEGLSGIVSFLASLFAWLITLFLWLLTFCSANFDDLFQIINDSMQEMSKFILELFYEVAINIGTFFLFIVVYSTLTMFLLYKMFIAKSKGNMPRSESLRNAFDVFIIPLRTMWNLLIKIKNFVFGWI